MARDKELRIRIVGDSKSAEQALDAVARKGHGMSTALKAGLAAAGAGMAAFGAFMKSSVEAAADEEKAIKQLSQAMQQHGTYSAAALEDLKKFASEQQRLTTFADDATLAAMHQLQTFGMNAEQMKAATKAAQDLAAAKGMDLTTAANLVGRAFAGNTAMMSRYGIVLDDARLQAEGFCYVLEALNQQFGGAAEAAADTYLGRMEQMKNAWGDLQETVGYAVLPALTEMSQTLTGVFQDLQESGALQDILTPLADAFSRLAPLVGDAISSVVEILTGSDLLPAITEVFASIFEAVGPLLQQLGPPIAQILAQLAQIAAQVVSGLAPVIQALAPILADIASRVGAFLERLAPVLGEVAAKLGDILSRILTAIQPYIDRILDAVFQVIEALLPVLPTLLDLATPILDLLLQLVPPIAAIAEWAARIAEVIVGALGSALEWVVGAIQGFAGIWSSVWEAVKSVFSSIWNGIKAVYDTVIRPVVDAIKNVWSGIQDTWSDIWNTVKDIVKGGILGVLRAFRALVYALDWAIPGGAAGKVDEWIAKVEGWHEGGWIKGAGEVLLPLGLFQGGEFVIPRDAAAALGPDRLEELRRGNLPVAAGGGNIEVHFHVGGFFGSARELDELARRLMSDHMPRVAFARGAA